MRMKKSIVVMIVAAVLFGCATKHEVPYRLSDLSRNVDRFLEGSEMLAKNRVGQTLSAVQFKIRLAQPFLAKRQISISNICFSLDPTYKSPYNEVRPEGIRSGKKFRLVLAVRDGANKTEFGKQSIDGLSITNKDITTNGINFHLGPSVTSIEIDGDFPTEEVLKRDPDALRIWTYVVVEGDESGSGAGPSLFRDYLRPSPELAGICDGSTVEH